MGEIQVIQAEESGPGQTLPAGTSAEGVSPADPVLPWLDPGHVHLPGSSAWPGGLWAARQEWVVRFRVTDSASIAAPRLLTSPC